MVIGHPLYLPLRSRKAQIMKIPQFTYIQFLTSDKVNTGLEQSRDDGAWHRFPQLSFSFLEIILELFLASSQAKDLAKHPFCPSCIYQVVAHNPNKKIIYNPNLLATSLNLKCFESFVSNSISNDKLVSTR